MKKTLIISLSFLTFLCLGGLFFYEKEVTPHSSIIKWKNTNLWVKQVFENDDEFLEQIINVAEQEAGSGNLNLDLTKIIKSDVAAEKEETITQDTQEIKTEAESQAIERVEEIEKIEEKIEEPEIPRKKWFLYDDESFQKFVSPDVSFYDLGYVPVGLTGIDHEYIIDTKTNGQLRTEAVGALHRMAEVFYQEFETEMTVVSTYRSYNYQKWIKDRGCPDALCAKAGHSEHQSWLAVDFWETTTNALFLSNANYKKYFEWLQENAHRFGYHNSYQNWRAIDGYEIEPWHWRYVWTELAWDLKNQWMTLTEYYKIRNPDVVK